MKHSLRLGLVAGSLAALALAGCGTKSGSDPVAEVTASSNAQSACQTAVTNQLTAQGATGLYFYPAGNPGHGFDGRLQLGGRVSYSDTSGSQTTSGWHCATDKTGTNILASGVG